MARLTDEDRMDEERHGDPQFERSGKLWHCNRYQHRARSSERDEHEQLKKTSPQTAAEWEALYGYPPPPHIVNFHERFGYYPYFWSPPRADEQRWLAEARRQREDTQ
jgi:hypothetical protein